jgi:hypothetical protein
MTGPKSYYAGSRANQGTLRRRSSTPHPSSSRAQQAYNDQTVSNDPSLSSFTSPLDEFDDTEYTALGVGMPAYNPAPGSARIIQGQGEPESRRPYTTLKSSSVKPRSVSFTKSTTLAHLMKKPQKLASKMMAKLSSNKEESKVGSTRSTSRLSSALSNTLRVGSSSGILDSEDTPPAILANAHLERPAISQQFLVPSLAPTRAE